MSANTQTTPSSPCLSGKEKTSTDVYFNAEYDTSNVIRLCGFIAARPKFAFGIALSLHLFMQVLTAVLFLSGYDILPVNFKEFPLDLPEDSTKLRTDAWWFVREDDEITPLSGGQLERGDQYSPIPFIYQGDNVFTRENLLKIKKNEEDLFNSLEYQSKLCLLDGVSNRTCRKPLSIIRFFDGTYTMINSTFYDPNFENIAGVFHAAWTNKKSRSILNFHLGKHFKITPTTVTSKVTRSIFYIGWPAKGFTSNFDRKTEQTKEIDEIIVETFGKTLEKKFKNGVSGMNFYYYHNALWTDAVVRQVVYDMMLAVASFTFIFLFMWFQTCSLWVTCWGMFSILSSFNIANLIYRIVLDYRYIGVFHVLSIFIILGIGSDNIFVFMDTWKQSESHKYKTLAHRLSDVYRKAAKTMFVTSITTAIAFLSNAPSPLLPISSFGIFSAVLIFVNYFSVILFFPTIVILHYTSRKGRCCCCALCCCSEGAAEVSNNTNDELIDGEEKPSRKRRRKTINEYVVQFFHGWFFRNVITNKHVRWVVLLVSVVVLGVAVGYATQLKPTKEQMKVWPPDTNWGQYDDISNNDFVKSQEDNVVVVHIIWGLKEQDRSMCHHTDFKCKGKTVFDRSFDLNPPPCQTAMMHFCKELKSPTPAQERALKLRRNDVTGEVETKCVFERMDEYLKEEAEKPKYPKNSDFSIVINSNKMQSLMKHNPDLYNLSLLSDTYYRYFEIGLSYFITDGGSKHYATTYDFKKYGSLLGGVAEVQRNSSHFLQGKKHGNHLAYVAIAVNTTLHPFNIGYEEGLPVYKEWERFVNNKMKVFPATCNNAFQATVTYFNHNVWRWLKVQRVLVMNSITGIVIGISLALVTLVLATTNTIVGLLATFVILFITCTVLGVISMIGWTLGPLESMNLTLVVGLAVDYVVHLAEGYMELKHETRSNKVRHALSRVGVSVLSGACSTLGASIFMLAARILFFVQFGLFIFATIGFSVLYSLFLFPTVMAMIGPQGETGSLLPVARKIRHIIRGQTKDHTDCALCEGKGFHEKGKYGDNPQKETKL